MVYTSAMTHATVDQLGLVAQLPLEFQESRLRLFDDPELSTEDRVRLVTKLIQQNSLLTVKELSEQLAFQAMDHALPTTQRLSILEVHMRLAGLDKKQDMNAGPAQGGYKLTINIGGTTPETFKGTTVDVVPEQVTS